MFPPCLETCYTQLALCLSEIQNLSLQPLQDPVLGAVTHQDLRNMQTDIAVCWLLGTVSGLFLCQSRVKWGYLCVSYIGSEHINHHLVHAT
jgi:hypothetical protein